MSNINPDRAIFRHWPELADNTAFIELGDFPTPVESNIPLGRELDIASLDVKRDDLSAADYGGNKIRKLEFLLGDALAQSKTHVVTFGGLGSNHALATALNCKKLGLVCGAVLTPEPETDAVKTALSRHEELGTHTVRTGYSDVRESADKLIGEFGSDNTYEIPFGGSSPVGTLGFINGALELAEQIGSGELQEPDLIYLACGTAGSVAGLVLGLCIAGLESRVEAILVTPESLNQKEIAERLISSAIELLCPVVKDLPTTAEALARINIRNDQLGNGYAAPTEASKTAARLWNDATGQPVSLTYTAKTLAALVVDARQEKLRDKQVMFWNTYNSQPWLS